MDVIKKYLDNSYFVIGDSLYFKESKILAKESELRNDLKNIFNLSNMEATLTIKNHVDEFYSNWRNKIIGLTSSEIKSVVIDYLTENYSILSTSNLTFKLFYKPQNMKLSLQLIFNSLQIIFGITDEDVSWLIDTWVDLQNYSEEKNIDSFVNRHIDLITSRQYIKL